MYDYRLYRMGPWRYHVAVTPVGATHKRIFASGVNSLTQYSLNLYLKGRFSLHTDDGWQWSPSGSSISENIPYPSGVVVTETSLEQGLRACVEPATRTKWNRVLVEGDIAVLKDDLVMPLDSLNLMYVQKPQILHLERPHVVARQTKTLDSL